MGNVQNSGFVINQEKADEHRERFLLIFKKTTLRIRDEERGDPIYLIRYSLFSCPWFSIKLHRILLSDDDCLHDHPWSFISFVLWGGYWETSPDWQRYTHPFRAFRRNHTLPRSVPSWIAGQPTKKVFYRPGSVLWRPAPSVHKLDVTKPCVTLVITLKRRYDWGFYTLKGWTYWKDYIRSGAKCE